MLNIGYVQLQRSIMECSWYKNPNCHILYTHLLLCSAYKAGRYGCVEYESGEVVTTLTLLEQETGLSRRQVRTAIEKLIASGAIARRTTYKGTQREIRNYSVFRVFPDPYVRESDTASATQVDTPSRSSDTASATGNGTAENPVTPCDSRDLSTWNRESDTASATGNGTALIIKNNEILSNINEEERRKDILRTLKAMEERGKV